MTPAMIEIARANRRKIGLENVEFRLGEIEHLPVADRTVDVVISNCVINLSPDKAQVFREVFRVLTPGGRLAVSDIVTDGPLPEAIKNNPDAWASCIAGALDYRDYIDAIKAAGFERVEMIPTPFDVEVNTVDFDGIEPTMSPQIDEALEKSRAKLVVSDGKEGDITDIEREVPLDYDYRRKVFSAKITALKGEE
jgi:SAM-dependent methyltransferase